MGKIIACKSNELESGNIKKIEVDGKEILYGKENFKNPSLIVKRDKKL